MKNSKILALRQSWLCPTNINYRFRKVELGNDCCANIEVTYFIKSSKTVALSQSWLYRTSIKYRFEDLN